MPANPSLLTSPKQRHGGHFEQLAESLLMAKGLTIVAKNWQQPNVGELDLICIESGQAWDILVFVEVRKRKMCGFGDALTSITKAKQRKLINTAYHFLQRHPQYSEYECRFDVVAFSEQTAQNKLNGCIGNNTSHIGTINNSTVNNTTLNSTNGLTTEWLQGAFIAAAW